MLVLGQINAGVLLEFGDHPIDDLLIKVVTTELVVARRGFHLNLRLAVHFVDFKHGDVKGSTAQIVDQDGLVLRFVHAVRQSGGRGFVDDAQDLKPGDAAGVFGRFSLSIGEVSRAGDDRLLHFVAEVGFCVRFQLLENEGRDLLRGVGGVVHVGGPLRSHVPLHGNHGSVGVGHRLSLGGHADESLTAVFGERHHRGGGSGAFCVRDHHGFTVFDGGHAAVCRS